MAGTFFMQIMYSYRFDSFSDMKDIEVSLFNMAIEHKSHFSVRYKEESLVRVSQA